MNTDCLCVGVFVSLSRCACLCTCARVYLGMCAVAHLHVCGCVSVLVLARLCVYVGVCACLFLHVCVCMWVCVRAFSCMSVCAHALVWGRLTAPHRAMAPSAQSSGPAFVLMNPPSAAMGRGLVCNQTVSSRCARGSSTAITTGPHHIPHADGTPRDCGGGTRACLDTFDLQPRLCRNIVPSLHALRGSAHAILDTVPWRFTTC